ncbi:hypothetical protein [Acetobacter sp.]|jgi:hypothetical protein|uniref:hypothetical protein n=1 Tax=Acetobacter sp. TaxID=440 RepID=UPI0025C6A099|nr:hypothetical protein [Acetobacter sp.]MCH4091214.1 hypothetical protein [Acetobacter sp.]
MSVTRHRTATSIVGDFVDPDHLEPEAVRSLLVNPLPGRRGAPLYQAEVVFHDGTTYPLAAPEENLDVRRYCQRLSVLYDWPVHDGMQTGMPCPSVTGEVSSPQLSQGEREAMRRIGREIADGLEAGSIPFGRAVEQAADRLAAFVALSVVEGGLDSDAAKEAAIEALNETIQKLLKK